MNAHFRDILKHSGVYGIGQILTRMVSLVMLPLYTRFLTPADYGTIAILDLTSTVLSILVSGGLASALLRHQADATTPEAEHTLWWTGLLVITGTATAMVVPGILLRSPLASFTLGPQELQGGYYYVLTLGNLWFSVLSQVFMLYFRVRKWSWSNVGLSLGGLLLNVALNVYFLAYRHWGIPGVLTGNLATVVVMTIIRFVMVAPWWSRVRFDLRLGLELSRFSIPLILALLLSTVMHQADRYLLRLFLDLDAVGTYSLAYQIGQGTNALFLVPFSTIWGVVLYDIAKQPGAKATFARVFEYYFYALLLFLFGVSLFVNPLLAVFATPEYAPAAGLVPVVCLSFVFFSIDEHFRVPALLAKRTVSMVPGTALGAAANIGLNLLLVPRFGVMAAAWVSVVTYMIFSGVSLYLCRRIDHYDYPLGRCTGVLVAMMASFVGSRWAEGLAAGSSWTLLIPTAVWLAWAAFLGYPLMRDYGRGQLLAVGS